MTEKGATNASQSASGIKDELGRNAVFCGRLGSDFSGPFTVRDDLLVAVSSAANSPANAGAKQAANIALSDGRGGIEVSAEQFDIHHPVSSNPIG
ncbi:hypothetical protein [Bradyrhizobium sp. Ghvi]|uniref:hypothetical protein n=1 Tax=Bradyrhizobium sp. Ghvi TaxID=1855319 RepID=UPI0011778238|nr:hypothetical protein [Bradyrhizobium sp. Ghvi]